MCCAKMKDTKLHIVGLEALDEQCQQLANGDPSNPDYVNKAWFFMYCYKVLMCPKGYSHDWGACPYAHTNESARRRDPQRFNYSSCICPNTGKGECPHGESCRYAHTLFEYWLHPARFRTQMCKAGANCRRALCFFAHSQAELRQPEKTDGLAHASVVQLASAAAAMAASPLPAAFQACRPVDGAFVLDNGTTIPLVVNTTALDSSSNVSCATCQAGSSPTALHDYSNVELGGPLGSSGNLQLQMAPVTAGLLGQMPQGQIGVPLTVSSSGLVTSMPQLQEYLHQRQQQQQLVAGMAGIGLTQNPVVVDQLHPSAAISNLVGQGPGMPASTVAAVAAPIYSNIMQGVAACAGPTGYMRMVAPNMQQAMMPAAMGVQQFYPQSAYQVAPNLQYAWM